MQPIQPLPPLPPLPQLPQLPPHPPLLPLLALHLAGFTCTYVATVMMVLRSGMYNLIAQHAIILPARTAYWFARCCWRPRDNDRP